MNKEKYGDMATATEDARSTMSEYAHHGADKVTHYVDEQPGQALMVACLAGFGVGVLLSRLIPFEESSSSTLGFDRGTAERIGRNLLEKVEHAMPAMLRDRLSS